MVWRCNRTAGMFLVVMMSLVVVERANATMVTLTPDRAAPQPIGTTIRWTATASGGTAPYSFKWWLYDGASWKVLRDWSTGSSYDWSPGTSNAGYRVGVWVRSAGKTSDVDEANEGVNFAIVAPGVTGAATAVTLTADRSSPQPAGTTITWTAQAAGGVAPLSFKWWLYDGVAWKVLRDWNTSATLVWSPAIANTGYRVGVWVRSAGRTADVDEVNQGANFPIVLPPTAARATALTLVPDVAAPQPVATPVTWTASAGGGTEPYSYKWWLYDGERWSVLREWNASASFTWTAQLPSPAYRIGVWVRSAGNGSDLDESNLSVAFPVSRSSRVTSVAIAADRPAPQPPGATIQWRASAVDGIGPISYKWWLFDGRTWTAASEWTTSGTFAWTPSQNNTAFKVGVWARSATNGTEVDESNVSQAFPISDSSHDCLQTIEPRAISFGSGGGSGTTQVTPAFGGCTWDVVSQATWISIASGPRGAGEGSVAINVAPNLDQVSRTGTVMVGARTLSITQGGTSSSSGCTFAVFPTTLSVGFGNEEASIALTAPSGCRWTAGASGFAHLSPDSGSGSATLRVTIENNTSPEPRASVLTVAGRAVALTQAGRSTVPEGCTYDVSPSEVEMDFRGGNGAATVTVRSGCSWTASAASPFVHLTGATSGNGAGSVSFAVDANGTASTRAGVLLIAGRTVTFTQRPQELTPPCVFTLSSPSLDISYAGGAGSVAVSTAPGCEWSVSSRTDWVQVTDWTGPSGSGTVWFSVDGNSGSSRAGTLVVAGQSFTISQESPPQTASASEISWVSEPDPERVGQCEGNCGAGCGTFFNPCSGPHYWEHQVISEPRYDGDDWEPVCSGGASWFVVRPRYVATVRWVYHGLKSQKCEEHDGTCRNLNLIPFVPADKVLCLLTAGLVGLNGLNYCEGAQPFDWSYELVDVGHGPPVAYIDGAPSCE